MAERVAGFEHDGVVAEFDFDTARGHDHELLTRVLVRRADVMAPLEINPQILM